MRDLRIMMELPFLPLYSWGLILETAYERFEIKIGI
jgi:hypothetical protein